MKRLWLCAALLAAPAQATPPMGTYLSYEGQKRPVAMANKSPLVATWISGEVVTDRGAVRCFTMEQGAVAETLVKFTVDQGIVTDVEEIDNSEQCPER